MSEINKIVCDKCGKIEDTKKAQRKWYSTTGADLCPKCHNKFSDIFKRWLNE